jgi:hypothetical protein
MASERMMQILTGAGSGLLSKSVSNLKIGLERKHEA